MPEVYNKMVGETDHLVFFDGKEEVTLATQGSFGNTWLGWNYGGMNFETVDAVIGYHQDSGLLKDFHAIMYKKRCDEALLSRGRKGTDTALRLSGKITTEEIMLAFKETQEMLDREERCRHSGSGLY